MTQTSVSCDDMCDYIAGHYGMDSEKVRAFFYRPSLRGELFPLIEKYQEVAQERKDWERLPTERSEHPEIGEWYIDMETEHRWVYTGGQWNDMNAWGGGIRMSTDAPVEVRTVRIGGGVELVITASKDWDGFDFLLKSEDSGMRTEFYADCDQTADIVDALLVLLEAE